MNRFVLTLALAAFADAWLDAGEAVPVNTFTLLRQEDAGARRGGAVRFAPAEKRFLLWGFMDGHTDFVQEETAMPLPEHDVVAFDIGSKAWRNHAPKEWEQGPAKPRYYVPRCYHGLTSGSERSLFRAPEGFPNEMARPDLNVTLDQVVYHPPSKSLVYFTGGLTVAYNVETRRWRDLAPAQTPPPVLGGSLAYDALHDEIVLVGGGQVAEKRSDGRIVGFTDPWIYSFAAKTWRRHATKIQPPPRMFARLVSDTKANAMVLFGGDGQSHYLADTWIFDLKTRTWRESTAAGPPPRAGHFTVFDPVSGWVIVGGGFQREDLSDLWAFDVAKDAWRPLKGKVPTATYLNADFDPESRQLLLVANDRAKGYTRGCDIHYAGRATYLYRLDHLSAVGEGEPVKVGALPKRPPGTSGRDLKPDAKRTEAREAFLKALPANDWRFLADPLRAAPVRAWGSATFDSDRGRILNWGGGHCAYGGGDVDSYDLANHTWIGSEEHPEYPHRLWSLGVRLAGVTFNGNPWTDHGRRIFAYDPTSRHMIAVRSITLTAGYVPEALRDFPGAPRAQEEAKVDPPTNYNKAVTWSFDPDRGQWSIVGPGMVGLDTLATSKHGVIGVATDWRSRLKDSGHLRTWSPDGKPVDHAVALFDAKAQRWKRLGEPQECPQNLYEMTSLAYDSKRDQLLLHGGGQNRDELWAFDLKTQRWRHLRPTVAATDKAPPLCHREMIYLPKHDVFLTYGPAPGDEPGSALWAYRPQQNLWQRLMVAAPPGVAPATVRSQNRALVYDPVRDLVLLVTGVNDRSPALVYAFRMPGEGQ